MDPWTVELTAAATSGDRYALTRDAERGLIVRVHRGVYAPASAWNEARSVDRHVLEARALALVADSPPIFSHWTAAALLGLPVLDGRLRHRHVTFTRAGSRGNDGVAGHVFALRPEEIGVRGGLMATTIARTVLDVAGSAATDEGVMVADAAMVAGVRRDALHAAFELAGPRKAARRIGTVIEFAHPGGKSAAESVSRWSMHLLGVEPPELQWPVYDAAGHAGDLDFWFPRARAGGEVDGLVKYLDPRFAPAGAAMKVYDEKRREDRVRAEVDRLARWGWAESRNPVLLRPVLARVGVTAAPRAVVLV